MPSLPSPWSAVKNKSLTHPTPSPPPLPPSPSPLQLFCLPLHQNVTSSFAIFHRFRPSACFIFCIFQYSLRDSNNFISRYGTGTGTSSVIAALFYVSSTDFSSASPSGPSIFSFQFLPPVPPNLPVIQIRIQLDPDPAKNLNPDPEDHESGSGSKLFLNTIWKNKKLLFRIKRSQLKDRML